MTFDIPSRSRVSKMSSVVAPSVSDGPAQTVSPAVAGSKMFEKTNNRCAERSSKVSESGGCPVCYAGRMGWAWMRVQNEFCCSAVRLGRSRTDSVQDVQNGFGVVPSVSDGPAQTVSNMSKMSSVVARSVSDGPAQRVSNMSRMFEKTNNRCAEPPCRTVLHRGCPICPECLRRRITVVLNDTPKCRSRTVVRLVMLAAWAK